jgi:hypothetical protein
MTGHVDAEAREKCRYAFTHTRVPCLPACLPACLLAACMCRLLMLARCLRLVARSPCARACRGREAGFTGVLGKPFSAAGLAQALASTLDTPWFAITKED